MKKRVNSKVNKKTISLFLSLFMVSQILAFNGPFLSTAYAANTDQINQYDWQNPYVQNFDDGKIGGWQAVVGTASTLAVENNQMKVIRGKDNNLIVVDQNSPQLADGDYEFQFTLKDGDSRVGAIFRYTSQSSWAFAGYNNNDGTWLIECPGGWKDGIVGPKLSSDKQYTMKVRFIGNKITLWLDGKLVFDENVSLAGFPTGAGKIGVRTWYDNKTLYFDNFKYSTPAPAEQPGVRLITNKDVITSNDMKVTIDKEFPNVVQYEKNSSVLYGTDTSMDVVKINGTEYKPQVQYVNNNNASEYTLTFNDINVVMKVKLEVSSNILTMNFTDIQENGTLKVSTIEIPNHNLLSVRSTQNGAAFAGSRMYTAVSGSGDTFLPVTGTPSADAAPKNYMYGILNTSELAGEIWTNSVADYSTDNDNERIKKQTINKNGYYQTGIWSSSWLYRAEGMTTTEALPSVKVVIIGDDNGDSIVNWQDGAIAFRSIMNNPLGSDRVPDLVVMRIPFNFASQAENPFLKTLDETKKIYLATDGLGQWAELKGYQGEGHDQSHLDYGGHIGVRQGGAVDMNTLVNEAHNYNGYIGVHISATGANPEANAFSDTIINPQKPGWDWLDESYDFDKATMRKEASTGARLDRLKVLKAEVPNLDFIYADAFFEQGFNGRRLAQDVNSLGWAMATEFPNVLEYDSTWNHWSVDYSYGGQNTKGYNSEIARFIRNSQKDTWIVRDSLLGGTEMCDFEGWQGRVNFNDAIKTTFETNLPTKYMQNFQIIKWTNNTVNFTKNVTVSNASGNRVLTKDGKTILSGNIPFDRNGIASTGNLTYLLPWSPSTEDKLYHWNKEGGSTTWALPDSWTKLSTVKLYQLSDQGKQYVKDLTVTNGQITIDAAVNTPYVVYKGEAALQKDMNWGEGTAIKDPGFNSNSLSNWTVKGEGAGVARNERGQFELKVSKGSGVTLTQQLNGLSEGTYSASVYVQVDGKRRALINVKNSEGSESTNYTDDSIAENYILGDSKNGTKMQRMRVLFDVPAGKTTADLSLKVEGGLDTVTFDDLRVVKTIRAPKLEGVHFYEDFENIDQGIYPFVKGPAGGINDPRTHLSELHAPYTQKGWNGKAVDDVLDGHWSLKAHKEATGLLYQTIPQTLRFETGKSYRVSFKYEAEKDDDYSFIIGDGTEVLSTKPFAAATVPTEFTKEFKAGIDGESWIGVNCIAGNGDLVIDNLKVEEISCATPEPTEITPVDLSTVPNSMIKATATSEETENEDDSASMAIDGDPGTIWHTKWDLSDKLPQSITLDLGAEFEINKVTVLPRQSGDNGLIKQYSLSVSTNGTDFTEVAKGNWDTTNADTKHLIKTITFDKVKAKHVKLTVLDGVNGWASAAEIAVHREPVSIVSAEEPSGIKTIVGQEPKLLETVKAKLSDGNEIPLPVRWDAVPAEKYSETGSFTVEGLVNGTEIKTKATVTVVKPVKVEEVTVETKVGVEPMMPTSVDVVFNDESKEAINVIWGSWGYIAPSNYAQAGDFTIEGKVEGTDIKAVAKVTVTAEPVPVKIESINPVNITTEAGAAPVLPAKITAVYSDKTTKEVSVVWDNIDPSKYSDAGNFTVEGKVEGTDIKAAANVTVTAKPNVVDKSALISAIKDAQAKLNAASVGTVEGQYTKDAKDELSKAINAAEEIVNNKNATQDEIDLGATALNNAINVFSSKQLKVETRNEVNDASALVKVINTVADKSKIVVDITKNTVVSKDVLNAIKGQDKLITFQKDGISWTIKGKDLKNSTDKDIDLSLKVVSNVLKDKESKLIKDLVGKETSIASFSFSYEGQLPGEFTIKVYIGKDFAGKEVNVCRYYEDKNTYEVVNACKVDSDGYISYSADHCSDYFVVENSVLDGISKSNDTTNNQEKDTSNKDNTNTTANVGKLAKTGSPVDMTSLIVFGAVIMLSGGLICIRKRKTN